MTVLQRVMAVVLAVLPLAGLMKAWPTRAEMSYPVNEQFIVELYSK